MPKYGFNERPNTQICFADGETENQLKDGEYTCLIGPNNSGKSFVLKNLVLAIGENATYLGPQRYNNFNAL